LKGVEVERNHAKKPLGAKKRPATRQRGESRVLEL
jgi:hypothetical protein